MNMMKKTYFRILTTVKNTHSLDFGDLRQIILYFGL